METPGDVPTLLVLCTKVLDREAMYGLGYLFLFNDKRYHPKYRRHAFWWDLLNPDRDLICENKRKLEEKERKIFLGIYYGYIDWIISLLSKFNRVERKWNRILNFASLCGETKIIDLCLRNKAKAIGEAISNAMRMGRLDIVKYLIRKSTIKLSQNIYEYFFRQSLQYNSKDITNFMIKKANITDFNIFLFEATKSGDIRLLENSIENGANMFEEALITHAIIMERLVIIEYFITKKLGNLEKEAIFEAVRWKKPLSLMKLLSLVDDVEFDYIEQMIKYARSNNFIGGIDLLMKYVERKKIRNMLGVLPPEFGQYISNHPEKWAKNDS